MNDLNFFSAADSSLSPFLSQRDFDYSLVFNILFQDKLLLHEAFFFDSDLIGDHILKSTHPTTLFEAAAENGIIIPAFRNENINTLEESYKQMLDAYGADYEFYNMKHNVAAVYRLYESMNKGSEKTAPFYWPSNIILGEQYYKVVKEYLGQEELPNYISRNSKRYKKLMKFWSSSKEWRTDFIDIALENTIKKGGKGLQSTEIFKLIGHDIGAPKTISTTGIKEMEKYATNKSKLKIARIFIKWLTQCYHINLAKCFGVALNFPVYHINEDFLAESIARTKNDYTHIDSNTRFVTEVELPPIEIFVNDDPNNLISIRNELGTTYLKALKRWQIQPNDENRHIVEQLFKDYCSRICKWYSKNPPVKLLAKYDTGDIGNKGVDLIKTIAGQVDPISGIFVAVGKLGHSVYQYFDKKGKNKPKKQLLEISIDQ